MRMRTRYISSVRNFRQRQRYRYARLKKALTEAGMKVSKGYHCIQVVVWEHPARENAPPHTTVERSSCVNWNDEEGYVWHEGRLGTGDKHSTHSIPEVITGMRRIIEVYRNDLELASTV